MKLLATLFFLLSILSLSCSGQSKSIELTFVDDSYLDPIVGSQVDVLFNDSTQILFTDGQGKVSFEVGPSDTLAYEFRVFNRIMDKGQLTGSESHKQIKVKLEIQLEEFSISEVRPEPLERSICWPWRYKDDSSIPVQSSFLAGSMGAVHMSDGSSTSFFNILQIER